VDWRDYGQRHLSAQGRFIPAGQWVWVDFCIPSEPVRDYTGNGFLDSTTGKAVFEELAVVPADGLGPYSLYLDEFQFIALGNNAGPALWTVGMGRISGGGSQGPRALPRWVQHTAGLLSEAGEHLRLLKEHWVFVSSWTVYGRRWVQLVGAAEPGC